MTPYTLPPNPYQTQNPYYNTFNASQNQFNQQPQSLVRVNGIDGARAYQMSANSVVALFDANDDYFYLKQTDGAGFPSIRTFRFEEMSTNISNGNSNNATNCDYVTRKDMEEYVKHFIQESTTKPNATSKQTTNRND